MKRNWRDLITACSRKLGLTEVGLNHVLEVVTSPPSRNPSNASRRNLIVDFASQKMGHTIAVESLTVEAAFAQLLEIQDHCLGYWAQPLSLPIPCTGRDGIKRTLWLTFDFLVLYADRVELVECKQEMELLKLSLELPGRFTKDKSGTWRSPEVEAALEEYGIKFRIISDTSLNPTLIRNYTLLAEARQENYSSSGALNAIRGYFQNKNDGLPLADLIGKAG